MRRLICLIMLLALIGSARGQSAYSYRYWFDDDLSTLREGTAQGKTTMELDIGMLAKGQLHALHVQALDARNKWGAVHTQHFVVPSEASTSVRYWFDNNPETVWTTSQTAGVIPIDTKHLSAGIHAVRFQMVNADGETSPVHTQHIYAASSKEATARYWFDGDEKAAQSTSVVNGLVSIDISSLPVGLHALHFQTFNAKGESMPVRTQYVHKKNELELSSLSCRLWIDDDADKAMTFGMTEDIVVAVEDLAAGVHDLHVVLVNAMGEQLAEATTTFEVDELRSISITLQAPIVTFSSEKGLDFGNIEGLKAYTAIGFHRPTGNVQMGRVDDVPAGEGLLLVGEPGTYEVPVLQSYTYYANLLVGTPQSVVIMQSSDGFDNYLLSFRNGDAGFYLADDESTVAAGKAYLRVPGGNGVTAKMLHISFGDDPDAIISPLAETEDDDAMYNLSGQRIQKIQKGIYIKGGKKILR